MNDIEVLALMREHAALCNLEAEVILALKAWQVGHQEMVQEQIHKIMASLQRVDEVRRRNQGENHEYE